MKRILKITGLVLGVLLLAVVAWGLYIYNLAGEFKSIQPHFSGSCAPVLGVVGAEDITIHPDRQVAYISSDDRWAARDGKPRPGAIFAYSLGEAGGAPVNLTPDLPFNFHPHGFGLLVVEDGPDRLLVVNHPFASLFHREEGKGPAHTIEVFDIIEETGALEHRRTIADPLLVSPNDVIPVGPERFYVTNDHGSEGDFGRKLEDYLRLARAHVLYYDGSKFSEVAGDLRYANGINISPDGKQVYVAATTDRAVYVYDRNPEDGSLKESREVFTDTGVDNIELDADGNLWIGAHPQLLTFVKHAEDSANKSPSQVLKLGPDFSVEEVFLSDGNDLSGSSVAARTGQRLLIGSVFDSHLLDCRLERE
jgi:arylesterase/paraoxonase